MHKPLHLAREEVIGDSGGHRFISKMRERNLGRLDPADKGRASAEGKGRGEAGA